MCTAVDAIRRPSKVPAGRHVDLRMKDRRFEKESLTAVMRAFMLEHEIARKH